MEDYHLWWILIFDTVCIQRWYISVIFCKWMQLSTLVEIVLDHYKDYTTTVIIEGNVLWKYIYFHGIILFKCSITIALFFVLNKCYLKPNPIPLQFFTSFNALLISCWIPPYDSLSNPNNIFHQYTTNYHPIFCLTCSSILLDRWLPMMTSIDDISRILVCLQKLYFYSLLPAGAICTFEQRSSKILYIYQFLRDPSIYFWFLCTKHIFCLLTKPIHLWDITLQKARFSDPVQFPWNSRVAKPK
jgi:hypothetical protein